MNTLHSLRREVPVAPVVQSMLKLQSDASKATSTSFAQYLNAQLGPTTAPADGVARQSPVSSIVPSVVSSVVSSSVSNNASSQNTATTAAASSPPAATSDPP